MLIQLEGARGGLRVSHSARLFTLEWAANELIATKTIIIITIVASIFLNASPVVVGWLIIERFFSFADGPASGPDLPSSFRPRKTVTTFSLGGKPKSEIIKLTATPPLTEKIRSSPKNRRFVSVQYLLF